MASKRRIRHREQANGRILGRFEMSVKEESSAIETTGAVVGGIGGAAAGVGGAIATVSAAGTAGLSAAGITSGLAAIGGVVGGGMTAGIVITAAAPVVVAAGLGYAGYRVAKWYRSKEGV
ncbi:hypothetical protein [Burkholderia pseudomallei]|uniref:hypothetical protein n=1 Tax=Burkholderia pseudomallei TaxID=28450 RepID=UPI001C83F77D|nr:hypothetical protein [Burkholderia pseudomallei]